MGRIESLNTIQAEVWAIQKQATDITIRCKNILSLIRKLIEEENEI